MGSDLNISSVDGRKLWLWGFPCLLILLAILYVFPLSGLNLPGLVVMTLGLSWCLYQYFLPLHLIRRHALLEHVTSHDSVLRRWLWNGFWSKLLLFAWSLTLALAVLIVVSGFSLAQWWLLLASVPLMLLLVPVGLRLAGSEAGARYHFPLALRVAVYLTIAVSTLGLITLQLMGEGVEDIRHLSLLQVMSQSWSGALESTAARQISWLLGVEAVINDAVWYLMQQASSLSAQSAALKLLAWIMFLFFVALQAAVVWFVLAGLLSWIVARHYNEHQLLKGANPARAFVTGVCLLALLSYLVAQPGVAGFINAVADRSLQTLPIPARDPCLQQRPLALAQVQANSAQVMSTASAAQLRQLQLHLDGGVDEAFALAEPAVERYLDWNFSLTGQYTQLLFLAQAVVQAGTERNSSNTLQQGIEQQFSSYTGSKIDEYVNAAMAQQLQQLRVVMQDQFKVGAQQLFVQQALYVEQQLSASHCLQLELPALQMPELVYKSAVGVGPVAGLVVAGIAARGGARVGANVLTRNAGKRAVSAGAAKVITKTAQSSGMGGLGLTCGPLAPVCVPALFVATWLSTDLLINEIDESVNRSALRRDMLAALEMEKLRIKAEYTAIFARGMSELQAVLEAYQVQRFEILRDGAGVQS
jgi:hypothetical protein